MNLKFSREDFISQYPPLNSLNKKEVENIFENEEIHLYLHIPYCVKKCSFCYYKSFSLSRDKSNEINDYIEVLKKELFLYSNLPELKNKIIKSIYIGGGSPTLLKEKQLELIIKIIKNNFTLHENYEFCCEGRPGVETNYSKLRLLKELGLKRLSLGCQSTDDFVLKSNGRNHLSVDFFKTFESARKADIESINIDIMSGMVSQSLESWLETVNTISNLKPENIAIYKLEIYFNNDLYKRLRKKEINLISDEEEINYIRLAYKKILDSNYLLADNFSFIRSKEFDHIHRREIWKGSDMLGIGLSSHSCFNNFIFQNDFSLPEYFKKVNNNELPILRAHRISLKEEMIQRLVFGIKNLKIKRADFFDEFGFDVMDIFSNNLRMLEKEGFISISENEILTTFEGAIFADDIVRIFYLPEHKSMMLGHVSRSSL